MPTPRPPVLFAAAAVGATIGLAAPRPAAAAWNPESFGPLDRPPALRPVGEPATVVTRDAFLTLRRRAPHPELVDAWALLDAGRIAEAEAAFVRLRLRVPGDGRATVGVALAALLADREDASLPGWIRLLSEEPEALAYVNLGWDARIRVAGARSRLHGRLRLDPRPADRFFLMSVCDTLLRDFPLARQHLTAARVRGETAHLSALAGVVERMAAGEVAAWVGTPPPPWARPRPPGAGATRTAAVAAPAPPTPGVASPPPSQPPAAATRTEATPASAPDLAAIARRLREAATAVGRFEVRLHERLWPLSVLPADEEPADREP